MPLLPGRAENQQPRGEVQQGLQGARQQCGQQAEWLEEAESAQSRGLQSHSVHSVQHHSQTHSQTHSETHSEDNQHHCEVTERRQPGQDRDWTNSLQQLAERTATAPGA